MIKVMKNRTIFLACSYIFFAWLLVGQMAYSATLQGRINGETLNWLNARYSSSSRGLYLEPSAWQPISGLMPTSEWVPGSSFTTSAPLVLASGSNEVIIDDVDVSGLSYKFRGGSGGFSGSDDLPTSGLPVDLCSKSIYESAKVDVYGNNCIGSKTLSLASEGATLTPFQFARPLLGGLESSKLIKAFEGKEKGVYSGVIYVKPAYAFKQPASGVWTYRHASPVPISIVIDYEPALLSSITVTGNGVIPAKYNTLEKKIDGKTSYFIKATGAFTSGLRMTFENRDYHLVGDFPKHEEVSSPVIPYSIDCFGCEGKVKRELVVDGELQALDGTSADGNWVIAGMEKDNEINVVLDIGYELGGHEGEIEEISGLSSGSYRDVFTVIFEANL